MAQADPDWTYLGDGRGGFYGYDPVELRSFATELEEEDPWVIYDEESNCD